MAARRLPAKYVYRETELGWQRAEPMPDLWGAPAVHRTQHFRIEHRARDAEAVLVAAAGLDELDAAAIDRQMVVSILLLLHVTSRNSA